MNHHYELFSAIIIFDISSFDLEMIINMEMYANLSVEDKNQRECVCVREKGIEEVKGRKIEFSTQWVYTLHAIHSIVSIENCMSRILPETNAQLIAAAAAATTVTIQIIAAQLAYKLHTHRRRRVLKSKCTHSSWKLNQTIAEERYDYIISCPFDAIK